VEHRPGVAVAAVQLGGSGQGGGAVIHGVRSQAGQEVGGGEEAAGGEGEGGDEEVGLKGRGEREGGR
jgi:hypothetical protein